MFSTVLRCQKSENHRVQQGDDRLEPTPEQKTAMYRICQQLTKMYAPIYLVTTDRRTGDLIIIAGEEIEASVSREGKVNYESTEAEF
ncbi:hypothetical protein FNW02_34390 [Komarekiella sp. 'clone 1']|uniref:DUF6888 domain-containing protein n=1 Tax=Komarekiella delphini-convector SJRDD-AB1 TaxID=2593771 RepID=A0AA40VV92_9NOST|nr:hypothetical protein [Komarekiella delphini-convector SJRDD-AB1]